MPTILLVEDNELNRDMLSRRLVRKGYDVLIAEDGAKGLSAATDSKPDLILMDMSLPVIDGWEATRRLKAEPKTRAIPVIALTAHAMSSDREKAVAAGCDDYDTKPVELERLLAKIERLLQASSPGTGILPRRNMAGLSTPLATLKYMHALLMSGRRR
jgi:CheY-like chemotaxis protein